MFINTFYRSRIDQDSEIFRTTENTHLTKRLKGWRIEVAVLLNGKIYMFVRNVFDHPSPDLAIQFALQDIRATTKSRILLDSTPIQINCVKISVEPDDIPPFDPEYT